MLSTAVQTKIEMLMSRVAGLVPTGQNKTGFIGGLIVGVSLGLVWTPCVGPILASVISLAITGTVTAESVVVTLAYATGTGIPMFLIIMAGSNALKRVPWLVKNTKHIQKIFGVLMILTALGIYFNIDRRFQTFILNTFPNYGIGLTRFEDNIKVNEALKKLGETPTDQTSRGKPMDAVTLTQGPKAPELTLGGQWFNSEPIKLSELKGNVVLVDFWTYTCINCQRTFPYLASWWDKYKDQDFLIIGVHSPEFEFEKDAKNVQKAIEDFGLKYPIMQDNDFATWRSYKNRYWPAKYLIDKNGQIRYTHFGEGAYDETEKMIQQLINEDSDAKVSEKVSNPEYSTYAHTPELYLGSARIQYLSSPETVGVNIQKNYSKPDTLPKNRFAFEGNWTLTEEYANPLPGAKLHLNFDAKEVYLVARTTSNACSIKVSVDEKSENFGEDVSTNGTVNIQTDRLYKLVKLLNAGEHNLIIEILNGNCEFYAFTFG
jgi:thiol-disulfide isomerase/thioredoxin